MAAWIARLVLLLPPLALLVLALPRLIGGIATNQAFPTTAYVAMNVVQPPSAYRHAADSLRDADPRDGAALVSRGRALAAAGDLPQALTVLPAGLTAAPAAIGGWTDLAAVQAPLDRRIAGQLLSVTFVLGPYDFWSAAKRAQLATELWPALDADGQAAALNQVRLFWEERNLRSLLLPYLQLPGAGAMLNRAYAGDPDTLRAINRWVSIQKRWFQFRDRT